jgi:hypothetical protein
MAHLIQIPLHVGCVSQGLHGLQIRQHHINVCQQLRVSRYRLSPPPLRPVEVLLCEPPHHMRNAQLVGSMVLGACLAVKAAQYALSYIGSCNKCWAKACTVRPADAWCAHLRLPTDSQQSFQLIFK